MSNFYYPWQETQWQQLMSSHQQSHLGHALLFSGKAGSGKTQFAKNLAKALLCQSLTTEQTPCQQCQSCILFEAGSHPDIVILKADSKAKIKIIKVADIRDCTKWLPITSQTNDYRIIIIENADKMNHAASNALLKTLEEPVKNRFLILTSSHSERLSATIRSRCQQTQFYIQKEQAIPWLSQQDNLNNKPLPSLLSLANGAPLKALEIAQSDLIEQQQQAIKDFSNLITKTVDPISIAHLWFKNTQVPYITWLLSWVIDLVRLFYQPSTKHLYHFELQKNLRLLLHDINLKQLYFLYDALLQSNKLWETPINKQLLLEKILIQCTKLTDK